MSGIFEAIPRALTARYQSASLNPTIRLGWVDLLIRVKALSEQKKALVSLVCEPSPRIIFETDGVGTELFFASIDAEEEVEILTTTVPTLPRRRLHRFAEHFTGYFPRTAFGTGTDLYRVGFSLFNFPDVMGPVVRTKRGTVRRATAGRLVLKSDEWFVVFDPSHDLRDKLRLARARGAHFVSHAGIVGRSDDSTFSADEVEELMEGLYFLISFALGRRTGPVLPYGIYKGRERPAWTHWSVRSTDPVRSRATWFDPHYPESLNDLFGPFLNLWRQPESRRVLRSVVSWYVQAHDPDPIENAIVSAQIAMEALAECFPHRPELDDPSLGKDVAGRQARLLKRAQIPLAIPPELAALEKAGGSQVWKNGPHATTSLRNDIVHPDKRHRWPSEAMVDAWKLQLWYLELTVLAWLGYQGVHNRRTKTERWVGAVEPVPWAIPKAGAQGSDKS